MDEESFFQIEKTDIGPFYSTKSQRYFEFNYVEEGEGTLWLSGIRYDLEPGCVFFVTPFDMVRMRASADKHMRLARCRFDWHFSSSLGGLPAPQRSAIDYMFSAAPFVRFSGQNQATAQRFFDQMAEEAQVDGVCGRLATKSLLLSLSNLVSACSTTYATKDA